MTADLDPGPSLPLPAPLVRAAERFAGYDREWYVCGGWATDLLLGRQTRDHLDVDLVVWQHDQATLRSHLEGWQLLGHDNAVAGDCPDQWDGRRLEPPAHIHANTPTMAGTELDIQICELAGDEWVLATEPRITLPRSACRGEAAWGDLPVVSAAIIVYYKAIPPRWRTDPRPARRPHDEADFLALLPTLSRSQRSWLRHAIAADQPDHDWLRRL
ncbi:nucleotidyltransferase domain-containing protein [Microlunatus speluncae]|uniref:nucleotidyltransferase domain-containing protein n=1 Tax=Microlunatus speluncae TaxID=2594267 RepID=UPI0013755A8F|nr:hypothetical protein [Microlunatus speluncae]